eukprot:s296_g1.t2
MAGPHRFDAPALQAQQRVPKVTAALNQAAYLDATGHGTHEPRVVGASMERPRFSTPATVEGPPLGQRLPFPQAPRMAPREEAGGKGVDVEARQEAQVAVTTRPCAQEADDVEHGGPLHPQPWNSPDAQNLKPSIQQQPQLQNSHSAASGPLCACFRRWSPEEAGRAADFLGRLHHLKKMMRMSATGDAVSVLIHKVGPLLVLDDGPSLESTRSHAPTLESNPSYEQSESQLMLASLDASVETSDLQARLCDTPRSLLDGHGFGGEGTEPTALQRALQRHAENFAGSWSLIPYDPENVGDDLARHWELPLGLIQGPETVRMGTSRRSRPGSAEQWSGVADQSDLSDFASFKLMAPNVTHPSKEERLDVYLENTMCDITKVVWGCPQGEAMS